MRVSRRGFTLVEVLTVVVIIGILTAILLPALNAAITAANNARVSAEESSLATALAAFKNKYGEYPPSRIILWPITANQAAPYNLADKTPVATGDVTYGELNRRTVMAMRKYFPRAIAYFPSVGTAAKTFSWGNSGGPIILSGDECLVFFLGGMSVKTPEGTYASTGFSADPGNPFASSENRKLPTYEFQPGRLVDLDGDGFPSYVDPMPGDPRPYAYFSAYGNNNYDPNDCNVSETDDSGKLISRPFHVNFYGADNKPVVSSASPNPYTLGDANPKPHADGSYDFNAMFHNAQSFQILSAGRDRMWGPGGTFDPSKSDTLPDDPATPQTWRKYENDNVTSINGGRLN